MSCLRLFWWGCWPPNSYQKPKYKMSKFAPLAIPRIGFLAITRKAIILSLWNLDPSNIMSCLRSFWWGFWPSNSYQKPRYEISKFVPLAIPGTQIKTVLETFAQRMEIYNFFWWLYGPNRYQISSQTFVINFFTDDQAISLTRESYFQEGNWCFTRINKFSARLGQKTYIFTKSKAYWPLQSTYLAAVIFLFSSNEEPTC